MLHVETLAPTLNPGSDPGYFQPSPDFQNAVPSSPQLIETSFRAVELDGRKLMRDSEDVVIGQLVEAVRLADLRRKPELKINNISPRISVGSELSCQVPILQKKIQSNLAKACKRLKRRLPECRLDLSHGTYSIRCYLGRTRPTDHIFDEDFVSDSR